MRTALLVAAAALAFSPSVALAEEVPPSDVVIVIPDDPGAEIPEPPAPVTPTLPPISTPTPAPLPTPSPTPPSPLVPEVDVYSCADFVYQEDAQAVLGLAPHDPYGLDVDSDGTACEELPSRPVLTPAPQPDESAPAVPASSPASSAEILAPPSAAPPSAARTTAPVVPSTAGVPSSVRADLAPAARSSSVPWGLYVTGAAALVLGGVCALQQYRRCRG